jgi:hypothetical protein
MTLNKIEIQKRLDALEKPSENGYDRDHLITKIGEHLRAAKDDNDVFNLSCADVLVEMVGESDRLLARMVAQLSACLNQYDWSENRANG